MCGERTGYGKNTGVICLICRILKEGRLSIKEDSTLTQNDWSSFDTQLRNFDENVCHQWLRLAGWGFYKVASTGKIVTKSHSDAAVLFAYFRQQ